MPYRPLILGFENELEAKPIEGFSRDGYGQNPFYSYVASQAINANLGQLGQHKYDGTINYGFEFASAPDAGVNFTSNDKKKKSKWEELFDFWNKKVDGVNSANNTGMHIHISKESVGVLEIAKMNLFINRNRSFCEMIGEREETKYCYYNENPISNCKIQNKNYILNPQSYSFYNPQSHSFIYNSIMNRRPRTYIVGGTGDTHDMKYRAINVARPSTVEFRFFKSTTSYDTFLKNMQFVIALTMFIRETPMRLNEYKANGTTIIDAEGLKKECGTKKVLTMFCDYVYKNRGMYKNLYKFLMERNYCPKPKEVQKKRKNRAKKNKNNTQKIVPATKPAASVKPKKKKKSSRSALIGLLAAA